MTILYQLLPWDTEKLGVTTGRIMPEVNSNASLDICLAQARKEKLQLLYWAIPQQHTALIHLAEQTGGILADHKITYARAINADTHFMMEKPLACYCTLPPDELLLTLAYASGKYSRFRNDPRLNETQFKTVYQAWITNSIKREIVDAVLVIYQHNQLAGMVTVGEKNQRGDIGLLAVNENFRGQGIGKALVFAALQHFNEKHYSTTQVVTQQENIPACRLYESCGFTIEKVEYFYHLWL